MFVALVPSNANPPIKLATITPRRKIHLLVLTGSRTVLLATTRDQIESPPPFLANAGLQISDTTGTVEIEWGGELWVRSSSSNQLSLQFD